MNFIIILNLAIFIYYTFMYNNQAREGTQQHQHKAQQIQQACYHKPDKFIFSNWGKEKKYLPEDGQKLTETCWRILRLLKEYDHFNVLF
jgi:hypothetical protein